MDYSEMGKLGASALLLMASAAAGFVLRSEYEKSHFVTERFTINSDKLKSRERNLVFLSDLHNNTFGQDNHLLIRAIDRIRPDAVLIGGDMMVCKGEARLGTVLSLVERLSEHYPVYYGNGNHEERMDQEREVYGSAYDEFVRALKRMGVIYLSDGSAMLGGDIRITACNMREEYYCHRFTIPDMPKNEIESHVGKADGDCCQILLMHSPLFFKRCRQWGADLTLSGHFHGGTIRLPFFGGVMTPQYQFFLPWCAGRFDTEGKTMIVSRGLGTHSINIRFNNRPQLVWIRLRKTGRTRK